MTVAKRTLKLVRVEQLKIARLETDVEDVILGSYTGLRKPELLTEEALLAVASHYPVSVCEIRRGDYRVVGNAHVAVLLKEFAPNKRIQVLVWKNREAERQQVSRLLAALVFGLGSQNALLRLWASLSDDERRRISSSLNSRVGLEDFAGISRKIRIQDEEPVLVPGLSRHLLPLDEHVEPAVDHHEALNEVDHHPHQEEAASEAVVGTSGAEIKPVILDTRTVSIFEYLLASTTEPSGSQNAPVVPDYLSEALSQVGLLVLDNGGNLAPHDEAGDAPAPKILDAVKIHFPILWQQAAEERESGLRIQLCAILTASCIEWLNDLQSDSLHKQFSNPRNLWAAVSALSFDTVEQLSPISPNAEATLRAVQDTFPKLADGKPENRAQRRHVKTLERYLKGYLMAKAQMRLPLDESEVA
ncbi:hypothetical protein LWH94_12795 [Marinobacter sp. G11]|uniref:hypothetical protein n=1 Tax=Marinobacter sp. G11 TaxID=2903522 RepID=UPI001E3F9098|nr:hypothetical protein [Marinobacter sp. G11]MCE0760080.1 hypothetical protein [Marinobacter sp. G11]